MSPVMPSKTNRANRGGKEVVMISSISVKSVLRRMIYGSGSGCASSAT